MGLLSVHQIFICYVCITMQPSSHLYHRCLFLCSEYTSTYCHPSKCCPSLHISPSDPILLQVLVPFPAGVTSLEPSTQLYFTFGKLCFNCFFSLPSLHGSSKLSGLCFNHLYVPSLFLASNRQFSHCLWTNWVRRLDVPANRVFNLKAFPLSLV